MKKIPYGIFDYRKLKEEGYIYVDKTMYLEKLEDAYSTLICLRPGRFGKSLFTSMMSYYYDVNSEHLFDTLFKDTYVYDKPTKNKNNYYILKFDFSGITTGNMTMLDLEKMFNSKVISGIEKFSNDYGYKFEQDTTGLHSSEILLKFLSFFGSLKLDHKLYILIDEYDNFTNGILEGDASLFKGVVSETGFVKTFYAVIKEYIGLGIIDRFFATGICPVTLNSMTTGFNIATDISTDREFNSMIGLTHEEVLNLLNEYDNKDEIYDIMIKNYDGYLFSRHLGDENRVFNATLVMYLLNYYERIKEIPENLTDRNITANYSKIENLVKLQNNNFYSEILDNILKNGEITGDLTNEFNMYLDFTRNDIISLLYYFGYLTIEKESITGSTIFKVPNLVMKETYGGYFIKILSDLKIVLDNEKLQNGLTQLILEGDISSITNYIGEILKLSSNRIFMKFDEKYIEALYFALLSGRKQFDIYNEFEVRNGYVDVFIKGNKEYMNFNIMIELKYIKKEDYSKKVLEEKIKEGKKQLDNYSKDERINNNLKKYLAVFVKDEIKLVEKIID